MPVEIPSTELLLTFVRSQGPGGQNVNKVNTKARLRWNVLDSPSISDAVRARFLQQFGPRVSSRGDVILTSQRYRDQSRNAADCVAKLQEMLLQASAPPKPRTPTRPTKASQHRRRQQKEWLSRRKQARRPPERDT